MDEPLDDPLLLFSVLYGLWVASYNTFDGDAVRERAAECLAAAEKQPNTVSAYGRTPPDGDIIGPYGRSR